MIHILPNHQRAVVFTLGKLQGVKGPGLVILIPVLQTMTRVDMRPVTIEVPAEKVGATITYQVIDPAKALTQVSSFPDAMKQIAQVTLRNVLAGRALDAFVFERKGMEEAALTDMNTAVAAWGLHVDKVELKR